MPHFHSPRTAEKTKHSNSLNHEVSRRTLLKGAAAVGGAVVMDRIMGSLFAGTEQVQMTALERKKAEFEQMSNRELAQWILDSSGDVATADQPVRTPENTPAHEDLLNMAEGKPAYRQSLLRLDGEKIKMDVEVNRDILLFRALLTEALRDPANYFEGKPILIQSGQLTNRSGSHKGRSDKSHYYGNSIDFGGAMIDGTKSDEDPDNLYGYDSPINQRLGAIADAVGALIGVETSQSAVALERVDSLHGKPGLSKGHYHYNVSNASAKEHAASVRNSIMDHPGMYFETEGLILEPTSAAISDKGRDFIHTYETFRHTTYGDAGNGHGTLTIGYGATYYLKGTVIKREGQEMVIENDGERPRMGDAISKDEADRLSQVMIAQEYTKPVVAAIEQNGVMVTQPQLDALVSYSFHRGGGNAAKLIKRLRKLMDGEHSNDALAIDAAFMYDINTEVAPIYRNGVTSRYLDTADIFIRGNYRRQSRPFDAQAWGVIINTYFETGN